MQNLPQNTLKSVPYVISSYRWLLGAVFNLVRYYSGQDLNSLFFLTHLSLYFPEFDIDGSFCRRWGAAPRRADTS